MWSGLFGGEKTPNGEEHFIYQSGLAFVDLTPDHQAALAKILNRIATHGKPRGKADR
jgi:catechol-2,3-dioxygenase